jgi:hypothetical protein
MRVKDRPEHPRRVDSGIRVGDRERPRIDANPEPRAEPREGARPEPEGPASKRTNPRSDPKT